MIEVKKVIYDYSLKGLNYDLETTNGKVLRNRERNVFVNQELHCYTLKEKIGYFNENSLFNCMNDVKYETLIKYMNEHENFSLWVFKFNGLASEYMILEGVCFKNYKEMNKAMQLERNELELKYNCRILDEYDVYLMYKDDEDEVSD